MRKLLFPIFAISILAYYFYTMGDSYEETGHITNRLDSEPVRADIERFATPREISDFSFYDAGNNQIPISKFKGKNVLINFWAEWCQPCVKELPELDLLTKIVGNEVVILPISVGKSSVPEVESFYEKHLIKNLPIYRDSKGKAYNDLSLIGIPTTILLNKEGLEYARISGYVNWESEEMIELLKQ